ncbi:MAG: bacterioferritin [Proteobacteria bacterium]|nr:bacterioferritin [Pseudomonadota bacterium]
MKGDSGVIEHLNTALRNELTAINQYFLHSRMLNNWGLLQLGAQLQKESIEEMHHADWLIERILLLEGKPHMELLGKLHIGADSKGALEGDLMLEHKAVGDLKRAIADCEQVGDYVSRDLFRRILDDEEKHIDWIETQLDLIRRLGLDKYEQSKL